MKYDLFISDYDGTLGGAPQNNVDSETAEAIKEYVKRGGKFVVCTGRMFGSIQRILKGAGLDGLVVAFQGAVIKDIATGEALLEKGLTAENGAKIVRQFLAEPDLEVEAYIGDEIYHQHYGEYIKAYEKMLQHEGVFVDDLEKEILKQGRYVSKVCALCNKERATELADKYNLMYNGEHFLFNNGADYLVEAIAPEFDKGSAVRFLAKYFDVPFDKILAVGDSNNDISLVDGPWHGVCVGDGKDQLKKVAKEITVPFKEKPVLHLLNKYCLGD